MSYLGEIAEKKKCTYNSQKPGLTKELSSVLRRKNQQEKEEQHDGVVDLLSAATLHCYLIDSQTSTSEYLLIMNSLGSDGVFFAENASF
jgi:hypothetical protein